MTACAPATGAQVEMGKRFDNSFFDIPYQVIRVNGADEQVFEFADRASQEAASALITSHE